MSFTRNLRQYLFSKSHLIYFTLSFLSEGKKIPSILCVGETKTFSYSRQNTISKEYFENPWNFVCLNACFKTVSVDGDDVKTTPQVALGFKGTCLCPEPIKYYQSHSVNFSFDRQCFHICRCNVSIPRILAF